MTPPLRDALSALQTSEGWLTASSGTERFASLFGRDALIAALQLLPVDPSIADSTLERLGRELGTRDDPENEEEPGKVPHEVRDADLDAYVAHGWPVRNGVLRYYGSVDASAWFLVLAGAMARGGHPVAAHVGAVRRVAGWLAPRAVPLVYSRQASSGGLAHHWWRDVAADLVATSTHGMFGDDGRPMRGPVAVAAVQALAWRALVEAGAVLGDDHVARAAVVARAAFDRSFLPGPLFAHHAEGAAAAATSDLGIILWSGILDRATAMAVVERLLRDDLCTSWGLRTLATAHPAFRPDGYHSGAVWPWDSWMGAAGIDGASPGAGAAVRAGVVDAVARIGGFPELYAVDTGGTLRPSAEACAVQAWTVGAVIAIERGWDGRAWA